MAPEPDANVEHPTTLPSGEPFDSSPPPSLPPPRKRAPVAAVLAAVLAAAPSHADAFLSRLYRCMQTRAGADVVLLFLCYASRLTGSVLETLSGPVLQRSARRLVAMAFKLPPATAVVLSSTTPQPPLAAFALRLGGRFKAMAALLSETRTMGRLWGLLGLYFAAKKLILKSRAAKQQKGLEKSADKTQDAAEHVFDTLVAYAQVISLISYQAAENIAYLSSKKVLPLSPATQGRLSLISVRSWALYVAMELGRLLVERERKVSAAAAAKDVQWAAGWTKAFTRNLAWAPLTMHWSMRNGPLPDLAVSLLASYPSTGAMMDLWRETA
ncbi:Uncharacterized protein TCAP_07435 [Tolypocladium capitatum]|uniref:Peroxin 11C n=1 Tax=Tolypocladium capitatum TaxID=45235 RepID=A0A2K3PXD9_9HYPO|nr:Uncharacterized protein TCAP_07435 [Tolypocladium capitatum]